jgi:phosphoribosylcarboxyaminoimidazole (NCAIR) mutase
MPQGIRGCAVAIRQAAPAALMNVCVVRQEKKALFRRFCNRSLPGPSRLSVQ